MKKFKKIFALLLAGMMSVTTATADDLVAFPGAAGWGRFAKGARATSSATVYHVTNLNDSGTGSLRDAVSQPNRIVVFDVAGVIRINSRLIFSSNLYVAGQTAPGEGITVYGDGTSFSGADNIIVRYMRFRMGHNGSNGKDCAGIANGQNMIFDHSSFSWGLDETFSINPDGKGSHPEMITLQNCIFGQGLMTHSAGGLMQSDSITLYRNFYCDNSTRNNKMKGCIQYVNNVVYNWSNGCVIMGGDSEGSSYVNIESNLFINGPSKGGSAFGGGNSDFHFYGEDNWQDSNMDGVFNPSIMTATGGGDLVSTPYPYPELEKYNGEELLIKNIPTVGASLPYRDCSDCYLVDEVMSYGKQGALISNEETLPIGSPSTWSWYTGVKKTDTDGDGMPDAWETANGTNPNVADATVVSTNGYLNIENYINSITVDDRDYFLRAPMTLEASKQTSSTITIAWRDYTYDEEGFVIEYSEEGSSEYTEAGRTSANTTSFTISNLKDGTFYNIRVRAYGTNNNETQYSDYATLYTSTRPIEVGLVDIDTYMSDVTLNEGQTVWDYTTDLWQEGTLYDNGMKVLLNVADTRTVNVTDGVQPASVVVNGTGTLTLNGIVGGTGSMNKGNSGTLILNSQNTYSGATVNHEGVIKFNSIANGGTASSLGSSANFAQNWIFDGGTYHYTGANASTDRGAQIRNASTLASDNILTLNGAFEGTGDLTFEGPGQFTIGSTKFFQYTGATKIKSGTLYLSTADIAKNGIGSSSKVILAGGTLKTAGESSSYETYQFPIEVEEGTYSHFAPNRNCYTKCTITGAGTFEYTIPYLREYFDPNISSFTGKIVANGKSSDSWGALFMSQGSFNMPTTQVYLKGNAKMCMWTTNGNGYIGGLSGDAGTYLNASSKQTNTSTCNWTIGGSNSDETFNGIITNNCCAKGYNSATNNITKVGTGYWRLTGKNTYYGTTNVNGGALIVNGTNSGTGTYNVASDATLKGQGTIAGPIIVKNGGTLCAGDSITYGKTLTLNGAVTLQSGATMKVPVVNNGTTSYKQNNFSLGSTLTIQEGAILELDMANVTKAFEKNNYFTVFTKVPSTVTGSFTISPVNPGEGLSWDTSTLFTDGKLYIVADGETHGDEPVTPEEPKTYQRTTLYSWESPEGTVAETGGTATMMNAPADAPNRVNYLNGTYYTISLNGKYGNMNDATASANSTYIQIALDETLQAGDSIWITAYQNKGTDAEASPYIVAGSTIVNDGVKFNDIYNSTLLPNTKGYSLGEGCENAKVIKLTRGSKQGTNLFITKIVVSRWAEATLINLVNPDDANFNSAKYNLAGQKVDSNYRGIVIKNGKKYLH